MYQIVHPENGKAVIPITFHEYWEASDYWKNSHPNMWIVIKPQHPADKAAFMQVVTGEIVVVRDMG